MMKSMNLLAAKLGVAAILGGAVSVRADHFYTPPFRGTANTESALWNAFTNAYSADGFGNNPNAVAPGGVVKSSPANIAQTVPGAFLIPDHIYSFSSTNSFRLTNTTGFAAGTIYLQTDTAGVELTYSNVVLSYDTGAGVTNLSPARTELFRDSVNGPTIVSLFTWNVFGLGVSNYTIVFTASGKSLSLQGVTLDTSERLEPASVFDLQGVFPIVDRWMYPHNGNPPARGTASAFSDFSADPSSDTRVGQVLLDWGTTNIIPKGAGAKNYLIKKIRLTMTIGRDNAYVYDGTLDDYRTYLNPADSRYIPDSDAGRPVEIYGVGYRNGYTAATFPQAGPFSPGANPDIYNTRNVYSAGYDTNGALVDVSNNIWNNTNSFEMAPFAIGATTDVAPGQKMQKGHTMTFDLNLSDPFVYQYVQQSLNDGNLSMAASCQIAGDFAAANYPDFYTIFNALIDTNQYPALDIQGSVVRSIDSDSDGLPDDWERFYFSSLALSATNDFDADGYNNLQEYVAGTNPTNAASVFQLSRNKSGVISFQTAASHQYVAEWSTNLTQWQGVTNPPLTYTSSWLVKASTNASTLYPAPLTAQWVDTNAPAQAKFYRINAR